MAGLFEKAAGLERLNLPFALVTIASVRGVAPRRSGRILVTEDGGLYSTIGGHAIEEKAVEAALEALDKGRGGKLALATPKGEVELVIDVVSRPRKARLIGFGHVGKAIANILRTVGYAIYVHDIRPAEFDGAAGIYTGATWKEALSSFDCDKNTAVVITTHDKDEILGLIDVSKAFYVGCLSSRAKAAAKGRGFHTPIGLDIAAETPEEIAVAVAAEIMRDKSGRTGGSMSERAGRLVVVRGAGDLATGTIIRLRRAGYDVVALETARPTQVRRNVSFAEAVYEGQWTVDGMTSRLVSSWEEVYAVLDEGEVPVLVDPEGESIPLLKPTVVVDAIIAKKNLGTSRDMAPLTVALGPGFTAGEDVDVVIETKRGHNLGKVIRRGPAEPNTGVPGVIGGYGKERVVRSSRAGVFRSAKTFGDIVVPGETIAYVDGEAQKTEIGGVVRGMLRDGLEVTEGFKIADVDPRGAAVDWTSPSDKARSIAGGVLEAVDNYFAFRS